MKEGLFLGLLGLCDVSPGVQNTLYQVHQVHQVHQATRDVVTHQLNGGRYEQ
jgi:hypothetical protein